MMADGLSAPEAVKAVHTIDTVVWGQTRFLPTTHGQVIPQYDKEVEKTDSRTILR